MISTQQDKRSGQKVAEQQVMEGLKESKQPQPFPGVKVQHQIIQNIQERQSFACELGDWAKEMKAKELAYSNKPIILEMKPEKEVPLRNDPQSRIPSTDYKAWDKFDVDKACEAVQPKEKKESEEDALRRMAIELRLSKMANDFKALGNQCLKEKNYEKAVEHYTEGIRCDKKSAVLYANRAQAYMFLQKYEEAVRDCNESLAKDPLYIKAFFRRAKASFHLGRLVDCYEDLKEVLRREPGNVEARNLLNEVNRKTMESLLSPKSAPTTPTIEAPNTNPFGGGGGGGGGGIGKGRNSFFPGIKTQLKTSRSMPKISFNMDDDEDEGGKGDGAAESKETWPRLVAPIIKPAARRSKRPLLQLHVKVVGGGEDEKKMRLDYNGNEGGGGSTHSASTSPPSTATSSGISTPVTATAAEQQSNSRIPSSTSLPSLFSQLQMGGPIPTKPKTAAQFNFDWKRLKAYPELAAQYLNQLRAEDYSPLFGESLEYARLSEILELLVWEFIPRGWDTSLHIQALSSVPRFSTLALFMTEKDRANARKLISHCPTPDQPSLYEKYALL